MESTDASILYKTIYNEIIETVVSYGKQSLFYTHLSSSVSTNSSSKPGLSLSLSLTSLSSSSVLKGTFSLSFFAITLAACFFHGTRKVHRS